MKVQCQNCQAVLNIPDDKLTPGLEFSFNCPRCKNKNTVHVPEPETAPAPPKEESYSPSAAVAAPPTEEQPPTPASAPTDDDDSAIGEFYEEGTKLALICFDDQELRQNLASAVEELGYVPVIPSSIRDVLQRIRVTQYPLILLHENFAGQPADNNAILQVIQPMEMTNRRRMVVILFGRGYATLDHMTAYALSVNAVVNLSDQAHFGKIIYRAVAEHDRFYRVFFDVLREIGKM